MNYKYEEKRQIKNPSKIKIFRTAVYDEKIEETEEKINDFLKDKFCLSINTSASKFLCIITVHYIKYVDYTKKEKENEHRNRN